jgi:hypothetical protein
VAFAVIDNLQLARVKGGLQFLGDFLGNGHVEPFWGTGCGKNFTRALFYLLRDRLNSPVRVEKSMWPSSRKEMPDEQK